MQRSTEEGKSWEKGETFILEGGGERVSFH
jgi:hypothetical protein